MDSGGDDTVADDLREKIAASGFVGVDRCIDCHLDFSWSAEIVYGYLEGKHVIHDKDINAESDAYCLDCHDPIDDGQLAEEFDELINEDDVPDEGLAAVTCEACHGTGAGHYGIGPMPNPIPDYTQNLDYINDPADLSNLQPGAGCGTCHNKDYPHDNPEGAAIVEKYEESAHIEADGRNEARCVKCHNDEGGRLYKNVRTAAQLYGSVVAIDGEVSPIQCRTCHDSHNAGKLLLDAYEIELEEFSGLEFDVSAEYATCTNCHQPHKAQIFTNLQLLQETLGYDEDGPNGDLIYHGKRWNRVIANTHYDDPSTNEDTGLERIEGYAMDPEDERVCRNCHDVHASDNTINEQWARSGHGGYILEAKEEAATNDRTDPVRRTFQDVFNVRTAGSEASWAKNMWPTDDRASCQRCHTATGAKNFLNGPMDYYEVMDAFMDEVPEAENPNDFSYLEEGQQELLFCWSCHTDNVGTMRNPGAVWLQSRDGSLFGPIPDIGNSNVCSGCHGGRANGEYVRNTPAASRSSSGRVHRLPVAGSLFAAVTNTGYEFDLDDDGDTAEHYVNGAHEHDRIGRNFDNPETGRGPCVSCHMRDADHLYEAKGLYIYDLITENGSAEVESASATFLFRGVAEGDTFTILNGDDADDYSVSSVESETKITLDREMTDSDDGIEAFLPAAIINQALCNTCHGNAMTGAVLQTLNEQFQNAMAYFEVVISGDNYAGEDFDRSSFLRSRGDGVDGKNDYGALQNYEYIGHDGGVWGYVHNSLYIKRILFDSLDWLEPPINGNGPQFDGSITIPADGGWDAAITWLGGNVDTGVVNRP
jgi:hypothetical protein